ncbi:hypothetical protein TSOC_002001 [Tetrabaena socialis]|uniref:MYND-type domain-containing protein n=1 Tax=Tetrabaena socialis TaxID=47790 RepID=A0A2J8AF94_9CHLO|nr:hypothetical protein TSOC_002001 [Tetrabaena socialis]|eukprot:PNH11190.1 hypothetical protein TSOC_002001 [Tetrabaena socialis]
MAEASAHAAALTLRLPDATQRLLSGRPLDLPEALSLQQELKAFSLTEEAAGAKRLLLAHDAFPAALLGFLAAALRLDAHPGRDARSHPELCRDAAGAAAALVRTCPFPAALDFATRLLRTDALQCYSRLLAAATGAVQAAEEDAPWFMVATIYGAVHLLESLGTAARNSMRAADSAAAAASSGAAQQQQRRLQQQQRALSFAAKFSAALSDSGAAEHLARATLHLHLHPAAADYALAVLSPSLRVCAVLTNLYSVYRDAAQSDVPAAACLREVLGGRCVQHLAISAALAALCAADGGPAYGLPEGLLLRLRVWDNPSSSPGDVWQRQAVQELHFKSLALLHVFAGLSLAAEPIPPPPLGRRAAVALLLRLGRFGVESARAWAEVDADSTGGRPAGGGVEVASPAELAPVRPPLSSPDGIGVNDSHSGCGSGGGNARDVQPVPPAAMPHPLRLHMPRADVALSTIYSLASAMSFLATQQQQHGPPGPLPPAPPCPMVRAALGADLLPCLERLLRRAGEAPAACEAPLACHLLLSECFDLEGLAPLLAYGEPRQAASLVATLGKLLASRAVPNLLLVLRADETDHGPSVEAADLATNLLAAAQRWMRVAARGAGSWLAQPAPCGPSGEQAAAAAAAVAPGHSAQRQLTAAVSYSVSEFLPPLSRLFQALAPLAQVCGAAAASAMAATASNCLKSLLVWVPMLSRRGVEEGAPAAAGGWRRWLLQEACVVPLLGAALGLLPMLLLQEREEQLGQAASRCKLSRLLGESCCCVAAAFPDEVQGAALSAAAAEESSASGGSRTPGGSGAGARGSGRRAGHRSTRAGGSRSSSTSAQAQPADWAAAAAAASGPGGWRPSVLCALAAELRAHGSSAATTAAALEDLARQLAARRAGGSSGGSGDASMGLRAPPSLVQDLGGGAGGLLPLRACGRCGAAWYCRPECQTAHWRSAHRRACGLPRG